MNTCSEMPPVKYAVVDLVLRFIAEEVTPEEHALVHVYLVEALTLCSSLGDIKLVIPSVLLKDSPLSDLIERGVVQLPELKVLELKAKHSEAYSIIQQALLLRMIED